jgi:hypothetical protein
MIAFLANQGATKRFADRTTFPREQARNHIKLSLSRDLALYPKANVEAIARFFCHFVFPFIHNNQSIMVSSLQKTGG